jgi:CRP-like cAMP-binding protein
MNRNPLNAPTRAFRTGEVIFREGDPPADEAFMVHIGRVEVRKQVGAEGRRRQANDLLATGPEDARDRFR